MPAQGPKELKGAKDERLSIHKMGDWSRGIPIFESIHSRKRIRNLTNIMLREFRHLEWSPGKKPYGQSFPEVVEGLIPPTPNSFPCAVAAVSSFQAKSVWKVTERTNERTWRWTLTCTFTLAHFHWLLVSVFVTKTLCCDPFRFWISLTMSVPLERKHHDIETTQSVKWTTRHADYSTFPANRMGKDNGTWGSENW